MWWKDSNTLVRRDIQTGGRSKSASCRKSAVGRLLGRLD